MEGIKMTGKEKKRFEARYGEARRAAEKEAWKALRAERNQRPTVIEDGRHKNRRNQTVRDKKMFAKYL